MQDAPQEQFLLYEWQRMLVRQFKSQKKVRVMNLRMNQTDILLCYMMTALVTKLHGEGKNVEVLTTDEALLIGKIMEETGESAEDVISNYIRVDTKTKRIMTKGWICNGGFYFAKEEDAIEWFNIDAEVARDYKTINDILEDHGLEDDPDQELVYYTEWYEI